ncbi:MAG: EscU/YscU/HrcU family type III secretion system export apparatus switch protein, partial [Clostridia bacterium]|nr:EscU/YscU/HrcU family type III secretion system export apparatus switch protein [Clostridia bacterium]
CFYISGALAIFSIVDYVYQWFKYEKDLMMSKYEVKTEFKQMEGDPQIKSRRQQKHREMAARRMMQSIPDADVVITNPTHFAVALKYDEEIKDAPIVLAKGQDLVAQRIKEIAVQYGIEIVENKEVARAIFAACEVGSEIPLELYQSVAEILAYVYKIKNGGQR